MKRKLLTFLLAVVASVCLTRAEIYSGTCGAEGDGSNLTWTLNTEDSTLVISGTGAMSSFKYFNWHRNLPWDTHIDYICHVIIESEVTTIGDYAFYDCANMSTVTIPNSIASVGEYAFQGCNNLTKVNISDLTAWCDIQFVSFSSNPLNYAKHLLLNDIEIKDLFIPSDVTSIRNYAFNGGSGLTTVTIPNSVTSIGRSAFSGCSGLTSVTIPNSVTSIGAYAFYGCIGLTSVTIPNNVEIIGDQAFYNVPNIVYSGDATGSPWGALSVNGFVEGWLVYDDESKTNIRCCSKAAEGEIIIPNSVTNIQESAFKNCSSLTSVIIPNTITSIESYLFSECTALVSVDIPNSVTNIGACAFQNCSSLTSVIIPHGVRTIESRTFENCRSLTSITIPNSVTYIGNAFQNVGLLNVSIPNSVTSIDREAFKNVLNVNYTGEAKYSPWGAKAVNGYVDGWFVYNNSYKSNLLGCYIYATGDIIIPNSVYSIGENAFHSCEKITSVGIPSSVTTIGNGAFYECRGLTSISIPNNVISIGNSAFYYCSHLSNIEIGNRVKSIGKYAFCGAKMTSIMIPSSVTSIGECAFQQCHELKRVTIEDISAWCNISFGSNSATYVSNNKDANPLVIAKHLFLNDTEIINLVIPDDVTTINGYTFCGANYLKSITIPAGVSKINDYAFGCSEIEIVTIHPMVPPTIYSKSLDIPSSAIVFVPNGTINAYHDASYWNVLNLIEYCSTEEIKAPTSISLSATHNYWALSNNYIASCGEEGGETFPGNVIELTGLEPETEYNKNILVTANTGETETIEVSFTTTALELNTQPARLTSESSAVLVAYTNMADIETSCGFEFRRTGASDLVPSQMMNCAIANGTMAVKVNNIKAGVEYKYRPYYTSKQGNTKYGDWTAFDPIDAYIEYEPIVCTQTATGVTNSKATMRAMVVEGSSAISEQGFDVCAVGRQINNAQGAPRRAHKSVIGEHWTVPAEGTNMKVTLTDLDEGTTYTYRTYVIINGDTIFGSEQSFTTLGEYLYTVTFVDYDGTILGTDKVHYGDAATAPEDPIREGYEFTGWDNDFSNVTDDLTITATYSIATALPESTATQSKAQKLLHDGQLFIVLPDGTRYTATGMKVE